MSLPHSRIGETGDIGVIGSRTVTLPHYFIDCECLWREDIKLVMKLRD